MRTLLHAVLAALALAFALSASPAQAAWRTQDCEAGSYLVGFNSKTGVWVDRLGARCAPWNRATGQLGAAYNSPLVMLGQSRGGSPQVASCPANSAIGRLDYFLPTIDGQQVAENVLLNCWSLSPTHERLRDRPMIRTAGSGRSDDGSLASAPALMCPAGQIARGFEANVDVFVGALRLRCVPFPTAGGIYTGPNNIPQTGPVNVPPPLTLRVGDSNPVGRNGAGAPGTAECGAGQALAGIKTTVHTHIELVTAWCANIVGGGWSGVPEVRGSVGSETPGAGPGHTVCAPGDWVVGIRALVSNAETPVLGFAALCGSGAGAARQAQQWTGHRMKPVNEPSAETAISCGPGKVAVGVYGWVTAARLLQGFGLRCAERAALGLGAAGAPPSPSGGGSGGFVGNWQVTVNDGYTFLMTLAPLGGGIGGSYDTGRRNGIISNGAVTGSNLSFNWVQTGTIKGSGTGNFHLDGPNNLSGTWSMGPFGGTWTAVRK